MKTLLLLALLLQSSSLILSAAERIALIMGNGGYKALAKLDDCPRDADLMASTFTNCGIRVHGGQPLKNLTLDQMDEAVRQFIGVIPAGAEVYVYYSGHGAQIEGVNYLLPIDFDAKFQTQVKRKALSLDDILSQLESSSAALRVVVLDSCRDPGDLLPGEPLAKRLGKSKGLAEQRVEAPETLVCFATKHGTPSFASANGTNSYYTGVLAREMVKPGKIEDVMKRVARGVYEQTSQQQLPFTYGSLLNDHFFVPGGIPVEPRPGPSPVTDDYAVLAGKTAGERMFIEVAPGVSIPFRWCPPGSFTMGSPPSEHAKLKAAGKSEDFFANEAQHPVTLSKGFWLAETEVTQGQWQALMKTTPLQQAKAALRDNAKYSINGKSQTLREFFGLASESKASDLVFVEAEALPIYLISHSEAEDWCASASRHAGKAGWSIELPTEAQWEYACRSGNGGMTHAGDFVIKGENNAPGLDPVAWYRGNSSVGYQGRGGDLSNVREAQYPGDTDGPRRVGQKMANSWGLRDMIGNVREWCADWYAEDIMGMNKDPSGPVTGTKRVARGGAWNWPAASCRAADRTYDAPGYRDYDLGFRPALVPSR